MRCAAFVIPIAVAQRVELLGRVDEPRREAGGVEQAPEVVPRVGEVGGLRVGVEARVDAAEDDVETRRENVGDRARRAEGGHDLHF